MSTLTLTVATTLPAVLAVMVRLSQVSLAQPALATVVLEPQVQLEQDMVLPAPQPMLVLTHPT